MKNKKITISSINYLAAFLMYVASVLNFVNGDTTHGSIFLCLGSANLSLGVVNKKNDK